MPNCKLCQKPLDAETEDSLCETCHTRKANLLKEQIAREKTLKNDRQGMYFLLGFLVLFVVLYIVITGSMNWKAVSQAEQLIIETVQTEAGYTPFASGSVAFTTPIDKIVFVNYGITKESLKAPDCPYYAVSVSGKVAKLIPFQYSSFQQSPP